MMIGPTTITPIITANRCISCRSACISLPQHGTNSSESGGLVARGKPICSSPFASDVSIDQPNDVGNANAKALPAPYARRLCSPNVGCGGNAQRRGKHNDHGAWGETRCPAQTQTSQDRLGWGVGRWCGLGAGSWPWRWAWRVGLGLAAALIGTSALSTLIPSITDFATCCADGRP